MILCRYHSWISLNCRTHCLQEVSVNINNVRCIKNEIVGLLSCENLNPICLFVVAAILKVFKALRSDCVDRTHTLTAGNVKIEMRPVIIMANKLRIFFICDAKFVRSNFIFYEKKLKNLTYAQGQLAMNRAGHNRLAVLLAG